MTRTKRSVLAPMALLALIAVRAEATTIVYTDRDAFNAAAGETTLLTFDPIICEPLPGHVFPSFCRVDYGLVSRSYEFRTGGSPAPPYLFMGEATGTDVVAVSQPFTAIGFDVIPLQPNPIAFDLSLGSLSFLHFTMSSPSFLGFVSMEPMSGALTVNPRHCPIQGSTFPIIVPCLFAFDNMALNVDDNDSSTFALLVMAFAGMTVLRSRIMAKRMSA